MLQISSLKKIINSSRTVVILILCAFFISGAAGLIHEVVWTRLLRHIMGNTVYSITTVLCAFMGGLALGSFVGGRIIDRRSDPLRVFAILEGIIALYCLALPLLINGAEPLYRFFYQYTHNSPYIFALIRFFFSGLILLVPATFMGASLPVLTRFFANASGRIGWSVGTVYGINTFGAVLGTVVAGFVLIPGLGVIKSIYAACILNATVAILSYLFFRLTASWPNESVLAQAGKPENNVKHKSKEKKKNKFISKFKFSSASYSQPPEKALLLILAGYGLAGFSSLVYEIAWTRVLSMLIGSSTYAFSMMLTAFILGLAIGSTVCAKFADRIHNPIRALAVIEVIIGFSAIAMVPVFGFLPFFVANMISRFMGSFWHLQIAEFLIIFFMMFIPTLLMGAAFPVVNRIFANRNEKIGRSVGTVYGANTIGTIIGSFVGGFVLIPLFGIQSTIFAAALINVAVGILFWEMHRPFLPAKRVKGIAVTVIVAILVIAVIPKWDASHMSFGPFYAASRMDEDAAPPSSDSMRKFAESLKVLFYKEGVDTTVTVKEDPTGIISLSVNGKSDASTGMEDLLTQGMLAHVPLMLHPDPKNALVVGLASGITLGTAGLYPLESLDCVEISPAMREASHYFDKYNHNILKDPRVNLITADGRNYLSLSNKKYDIIISEPSNPWMAGVADLFTKEFFDLCRKSLNPQGIMCEWLHIYNMDLETFRSIVYTFYTAFPNATIWKPAYGDCLLIGSIGDMSVDYSSFIKRMSNPAIASDLKRINLASPNVFLGRLMMGPAGIKQMTQGAALHTDDNALVEFAAPRAMTNAVSFQPDLINALRLNWEADLSFLTAKPANNLKLMTSKKAIADFIQARKYLFQSDFYYSWDQEEEGLQELNYAIGLHAPAEVFTEFTEDLYAHAMNLAKSGNTEHANVIFNILTNQYAEVVKHNPGDFNTRNVYAEFLYRTGRAGEALQQYRTLLKINPKQTLIMNNIATILLNKQFAYYNPSEALILAKKASELAGNNNALYLYTLSVSYEALGKTAEAKEAAYKAWTLARKTGDQGLVSLIQSRFSGYR